MPEWVYVIRPAREGFKTEPTEEEQSIMAEHFGYLKRLFDDGKLTLAGPALDTTFGIVVFEAEGYGTQPDHLAPGLRMVVHDLRFGVVHGHARLAKHVLASVQRGVLCHTSRSARSRRSA